ncbi:MAG: class I SAM-dependent methyltransferase [Rhodospirillaceae bacterium]|nr:class I SAM-dependent methyltransferase [Rhodospirillaceae bacterium]
MSEQVQKSAFLEGEGDQYFKRNREVLADVAEAAARDPVAKALSSIQFQAGRVLEVGAMNGWRLEWLRHQGATHCAGIDPSESAIADGKARFTLLHLHVGTAEMLPFADKTFDTVIFGFCLYLCDRRDLFKIASECDRVLADQGRVIIYDFLPDFPYRNAYHHKPGLFSYKMDYGRLFDWNPAYRREHQIILSDAAKLAPSSREAVIILRKSEAAAYADSPYAP